MQIDMGANYTAEAKENQVISLPKEITRLFQASQH
ncbi:MAG: hypothetical protein ACI8SR_002607 [Oceanicoccus sp.]|jgi:hypothetical protein